MAVIETAESVFDVEAAKQINRARQNTLSLFLPGLIESLSLRTALDVGCGVGFFSEYLAGLGLEVTGLDARAENVAEARRRWPEIRFEVRNVEEPTIRERDRADLVLCFGLLYHLENPFLALRNLEAVTSRLLLVESMILPGQRAAAALFDEAQAANQALQYVAYIPSESAIVKMLYAAGFPFVYRLRTLPDHHEFRETRGSLRRRTMLAASRSDLQHSLFQPAPCPEQRDLWQRRRWIGDRVPIGRRAGVEALAIGLAYYTARRWKQRQDGRARTEGERDG